MEAVGLVASIITLVGAASLTGSSLTRLWGLRGSPLYIISALNEVNDFKATLSLIQSTLSVKQVPEDVVLELGQLLDRARIRLDEFDRYLKEKVLQESPGKCNLDRPKLRRRAKLKEILGEAQQQIDGLQQGLLSIKVSLALALGVAQLRTTPGLFTSIQQISVVRAGNLSQHEPGVTADSSLAIELERATTSCSRYSPGHPTQTTSDHESSLVDAYVQIETKPLSRNCHRTCPCQCHIPMKATAPRWLQGLIGAAFVNFTGTPLINQRSCNFRNCGNGTHASGSMRLSYLFPAWLLRSSIDFTASWSSLSGVSGTWSLKVPRTVDDGAIYMSLFNAVDRHSVLETRRIMDTFGIRAFDNFPLAHCQNLLELAMGQDAQEICHMLLDDGADVDLKRSDGLTSAAYIWLRQLQSNEFEKLQHHPKLEDARDELGLTVLHDHIIKGNTTLVSNHLKLEAGSSLIRDCWGATPLHWAARFANLEAIAALLSAGADANAICKLGRSVLLWAIDSSSVLCCKALLDAGVDASFVDDYGNNALIWSLSNPNIEPAMFELLLGAGLDLEARDIQGSTALMNAARCSSPTICGMLLDHGANIDACDGAGRSAMCYAILFNNHLNVRLFVQRGASFNVFGHGGHSIVSYAAAAADIDTMSTLEEARIEGLHLDDAIKAIYWAWFDHRDDYFIGQRAPLEDERSAFQALLDSIKPCLNLSPLNNRKIWDVPGSFPCESTYDNDSILELESGGPAEQIGSNC